jgi:FkbM family methyltransferase
LLAEDIGSAEKRAAETYDRATTPLGGRIVVYGSGGLGQSVVAGLRAAGLDVLAFADRNPASWSRQVCGLAVLSLDDAARQFGPDAVFVVAVWNSKSGGTQRIITQLKAAGCRRVVPFVWLYWKFPEAFLPFYLWDLPVHVLASADEVRRTYDLFSGVRSQGEFLRHLEFLLTGDFGCLRPPERDPAYFPTRIFRPRADECFVDCGAFNGDSLKALADWTGGRFRKALAFEADPESFASLNRVVECDDRLRGRVRAIQQAVGREKRIVSFAASGLGSSAMSASGTTSVECASLDETLANECPTYIKMDIEGAEMDGLAGAAATLKRHRPTLAICSYHLQDHLWRVPARIIELAPDARLLLRTHCVDGFDLVCYAVPRQGREADLSMDELDN